MSDEKKAGRVNMTTLCYIECGNKYLMLHRVKKENDINKDKWVGVGGHFEDGESPDECLLREVREETGLVLTSYEPRGFITFVSSEWGTEYMHLYTADGYSRIGENNGRPEFAASEGSNDRSGEPAEISLPDCREGELCWIEKSKVCDLPLWEGDKIFFRLLEGTHEYFFLKLEYDGERLLRAVLNGKKEISR